MTRQGTQEPAGRSGRVPAWSTGVLAEKVGGRFPKVGPRFQRAPLSLDRISCGARKGSIFAQGRYLGPNADFFGARSPHPRLPGLRGLSIQSGVEAYRTPMPYARAVPSPRSSRSKGVSGSFEGANGRFRRGDLLLRLQPTMGRAAREGRPLESIRCRGLSNPGLKVGSNPVWPEQCFETRVQQACFLALMAIVATFEKSEELNFEAV